MKIHITALITLLVLVICSGCAARRGVHHTIGKGETLWRISRTYGVEMSTVARANGIKDPTDIETGQKILIPGVRKKMKVAPYVPPDSASAERPGSVKAVSYEKGRFIWPVSGEVSSRFGVRGGVMHEGIDIRANEGTPVLAADDGQVVYVNADMRGHGKILIVRHRDDFYTVYSHNKQNLASEGDTVHRGAAIATVGNTGNAQGYHLHFEVRRGKDTLDPLFFLP